MKTDHSVRLVAVAAAITATAAAPWATTIAAPTDSPSHTQPITPTTAVTHSSGDVFSLGSELIAYIETHLEHVLRQGTTWRYAYQVLRSYSNPARELHTMFELHSKYLRLNLERQRELITDANSNHHGFIQAEISVIESQKQTVERLIGAYTAAVFAQQSELANLKSNGLAILGVVVAITAVILTDFRFQSLLK